MENKTKKCCIKTGSSKAMHAFKKNDDEVYRFFEEDQEGGEITESEFFAIALDKETKIIFDHVLRLRERVWSLEKEILRKDQTIENLSNPVSEKIMKKFIDLIDGIEFEEKIEKT